MSVTKDSQDEPEPLELSGCSTDEVIEANEPIADVEHSNIRSKQFSLPGH